MAIMNDMRSALANLAVKYMGQDRPIPDLEFVMTPEKRADLILESRINDPELVSHDDGSWSFRGVPIRTHPEQANWTLQPPETPNE